jgi:hypothetical protein
VNNINLSAFGSTQPVYDGGSGRIRWFCPWHVDEPNAIERALDMLGPLEREVKASRITVRLVSAGALDREAMSVLVHRGFKIEARMAVADTQNVTYVARNFPGRHSAPEDLCSEKTMLRGIMAKPRKGGAAITREFQQLGDFHVEMVKPDTLSHADITRLIELHYDAFPDFPYNFERKLALMLRAPDIYVMCQVRSIKNDQIYAFSNLEINTVTLDDGKYLRLAEYDNSFRATSCPEHGELSGLGAILRFRLALEAYRRGADLCHAESRASLAAINSNSYHLGMCFGGTLQKHLLISGQTSIDYMSPSQFESMNVWYLNRTHLATLSRA